MKKVNTVCWQMIGISGLFLLMNPSAIAHNKVVVVPLNSSKKISNNSSPCNFSTAGIIRWTGSDFEGCDGSYWGRFSLTAKVPVVTSGSDHIWMDRNLGASRVATSSSDYLAYGDLYQWGRLADGHEDPTSSITPVNSSGDVPTHGDFITESDSPYDWRDPQNNNLWQGISGINNPCPSGFRLPTISELDSERTSWSSDNAAGAFASPLKFGMAGGRSGFNGILGEGGSKGYYWSSTIIGDSSYFMGFDNSSASTFEQSAGRVAGFSVRCIMD